MRACSVQRKIKYLRACSGWVAGRRGGLGEGGIHCCGGSKGKRDNAIFKLLNVRMQGYVGDSRDYINIVTSFSSRYGVHSSLITPAQGLKPKFSQPAAAQVIDSSPCAPFIPVYSSFPWIFLDSPSGQHCRSRHRKLPSCETTSITRLLLYNSPLCSESTLSQSISARHRVSMSPSTTIQGSWNGPNMSFRLLATWRFITFLSSFTSICSRFIRTVRTKPSLLLGL